METACTAPYGSIGTQHGVVRGDSSPTWTVSSSRTVQYEVRVTPDVLDPGNGALAAAGTSTSDTPRRLLVLDEQVDSLYRQQIVAYFEAQKVDLQVTVLTAHEEVKTMDSVFRVVESMDRFGIARRHEPVIAVGGGVLMDIVGLAASLYRRSTPYVRVPTTLIGMIDAGIGAKTGVNVQGHKNRLGTYHPSTATLVDPAFLNTLEARHIANGLAEILKIALVKDAELFDLLERHGERLIEERLQADRSVDQGTVAAEVVRRAIHGMLAELQPNLWEEQLQRLVDYGHTFSPAIEMAALPHLLHGEAVCVDMALTTVLARRRGLLSAPDELRILATMRRLSLPLWNPLMTGDLLERALKDTIQHRDGEQRMPLPVGIGAACFVNDVTPGELRHAAEHLACVGD